MAAHVWKREDRGGMCYLVDGELCRPSKQRARAKLIINCGNTSRGNSSREADDGKGVLRDMDTKADAADDKKEFSQGLSPTFCEIHIAGYFDGKFVKAICELAREYAAGPYCITTEFKDGSQPDRRVISRNVAKCNRGKARGA
jgi:hypothetical protein